MKKYYIVLAVLLHTTLFFSQEGGKQTYLPTYTPPSPTVAALMKFEEVPVDNYTGIPDISIPIFNNKAKDNNLEVNFSLKYHPSSIAVDAIASDVGLGWSLFAGGTISRVVKDLPDELMITEKRIGIYHSANSSPINNYYQVLGLLGNIQNSAQQEIVDEFMWEANEKKKYDTQHDLWQFNFMGYTGRFYIKKNLTTGLLEVVPLENYNLKIKNIYNTNHQYPNNVRYTPMSFEVTDTKGYKYYFEEYEETDPNSFSNSTYYPDLSTITPSDPLSKKYRSAFHLTRVTTMNDKPLVTFSYSGGFNENTSTPTTIYNHKSFDPQPIYNSVYLQEPSGVCPEGGDAAMRKLEPTYTSSSSTNSAAVKKLTSIMVEGVAKIYFTFEAGRSDTYYGSGKGCKLNEISIKNWKDQNIRKYKFNYEYKQLIKSRLFLNKLEFQDSGNATVYDYRFDYETYTGYAYEYGRDAWGYYNLPPECAIIDRYKVVSPKFCTSQVLQKIKLPTGGSQIFDFESNDFSYIANEPLTEFDANVNNLTEDIEGFYSTVMHSQYGNETFESIGTLSEEKHLVFDTHIQDNSGLAGSLVLYKRIPNQPWQTVTALTECTQYLTLQGGFEYRIRFKWHHLQQTGNDPLPNLPIEGTATINIDWIPRSPEIKKLEYGGGVRIGRIGYFDYNADKDYYKIYYNRNVTPQPVPPAKQKLYSYRMKDDVLKSSGALVFPRPVFNYIKTVKACIDCGGYSGNRYYDYETWTDYNNLQASKSRGADVGYKHVTVSETGNGSTEFYYTTSIDDPDLGIETSNTPPFLPIQSNDFKRGLLLTQEVFDNTGKALTKLTNDYDVEVFSQTTGLSVFSRSEDNFSNSYKFANYNIFKTYRTLCKNPAYLNYNCSFVGGGPNPSMPTCPCRCYNGQEVSDYIFSVPVVENYGWVKLTATTEENYFYDINNNESGLNKVVYYEYNPLNRQVAQKTETTSRVDDMITKYHYAKDASMSAEPHRADLITQNIIETPLTTEVYRGTAKISEQKTVYDDWGSLLMLPQIIQTAKGSAALENRARFTKYDDLGHPIEMQMENGTKTVLIWGYQKSQLIAKLENVAYTTAMDATIANLQGLSDADNDKCISFPCTGTEESLRTALNSLRATYPNAMITTFTYDPLVGVTSVTDPKQNTAYYEYDNFGRLIRVRDTYWKILSENDYHYKN